MTKLFRNLQRENHPLLLLVVAIFLMPAWHHTAMAQSSPSQVDQSAKGEIIDWICSELVGNYVFPEVAERVEIHLRKQLSGGHYDRIISMPDFARVLTGDLQRISEDGHLKVLMNSNPPPDSIHAAQREAWRRQRAEQDRLENFHFREIKHLSGNVGYLRFDAFDDPQFAGPTAVAAMNFLSTCDALIVDLRYNGGGHTTLIQLLLSYFFDEPVHTMNSYTRNTDFTEQEWTYAYVNGPKMVDTDLYVLTGSKMTYSAAEHFAFALKNLGRATIVGETTSGGAHHIAFRYLRDAGLELRVPIGRGFDPNTGLDWEGVGVEPDVWTPEEEALDAAHVLALKKLYESAEGERRADLQWTWEYHQARVDPVDVDSATLRSYEGQYGPVRISVKDGRLHILVPGNRKLQRLCALSETVFVVESDETIRGEFVRDEQNVVVALEAAQFNGMKRHFPKAK